jgi:hypothetical protein
MDDLQKLKHLIEHWKEHNEEHAQTYLEWSKKADGAGRGELASSLKGLWKWESSSRRRGHCCKPRPWGKRWWTY